MSIENARVPQSALILPLNFVEISYRASVVGPNLCYPPVKVEKTYPFRLSE